MRNGKLVMDSDVLRREPSGAISGRLTFHLDDVSFPYNAWSDFVVVVLRCWCEAGVRLLQGERGAIQIRFMEGPHFVEVAPAGTGVWNVSLVDVGTAPKVRERGDVHALPLAQSIVDASDEALAACARQHLVSNDVDELGASVAILRAHLTDC